MNEVVLVTGSETLTGRKLIEKLLARGSQVVAPVAGKETDTNKTDTPNLTVLTWNRSSWFSTKAVIREIIRQFGRIDTAWLLHQPAPAVQDFSDAGSSDIELVLEQSIKGSIAMTREVLPLLEASGGFLGMVLPHRTGAAPGPLDALASGAFKGFSGALIRETNPLLWACGFQGNSPDADGFASEPLRVIDEQPDAPRGRWYRYADGRRPVGGSAFVDTIN